MFAQKTLFNAKLVAAPYPMRKKLYKSAQHGLRVRTMTYATMTTGKGGVQTSMT